MTSLAFATAAVALLMLCLLLPFLPGSHDVLAVSVSVVAQALGFAGLLLVPIGIAWLLHGARHRAGDAKATIVRRRYSCIVLVLLLVLGLLGALFSFAQAGASLAIPIVAATALGGRAAFRMRARRSAAPGPDRATPLCCIGAPIGFLLLQAAVAAPATEFARDRAIARCAPLLADIEQFRATRGHYPQSLQSVWEDYSPSVLGISRYHYEPQWEACNLFFEMPSLEFGVVVIVMWNPRDEQVMTSHNSDLLRRSAAELELRRGFFSVQALPQPHWKAFTFD